MNLPSFIECLESRIAPASVAATLSHGILKIVAADVDASADFHLYQTGARSFDLYDQVSTEPIHFNGVKGIKATLSSVDDHAAFILAAATPFHGSIAVDAKEG